MSWTFTDFQLWYCDLFKKGYPLDWQNTMNAIIYYLTESVPETTQFIVTANTTVSTGIEMTGTGVPDDPFIIHFYLNTTALRGPQGETGTGWNDLTKLDIVTGTPVVTYDSTSGAQIVADGKAYAGTQTFDFEVEMNLPIVPGENINIDATENADALQIKAVGGQATSKLYVHTFNLSMDNSAGTGAITVFGFSNNGENITDFSEWTSNIWFSCGMFIESSGESRNINEISFEVGTSITLKTNVGASYSTEEFNLSSVSIIGSTIDEIL